MVDIGVPLVVGAGMMVQGEWSEDERDKRECRRIPQLSDGQLQAGLDKSRGIGVQSAW